MTKRNSFDAFVDKVIKAIKSFLKFMYDNIVWFIIVILMIDILAFLFIRYGGILSIINSIILVMFAIRLLVDMRKNRKN